MKNKAIIITGAGGNVGSYMAEQYLKAGENLILCIHKDSTRLQEMLQKYPDQTRVCIADISDIDSLERNLSVIIQSPGWRPKALIHTVTIRSHDFKPLIETDPKLWKRIIAIRSIVKRGCFNANI